MLVRADRAGKTFGHGFTRIKPEKGWDEAAADVGGLRAVDI